MMFDSNVTLSNHVSQVIKSTRVHARDLYRIHPLLDLKTSVLLSNGMVSSRLDYCNSLFISLTDFELRRLQRVKNSLFRVVTHSPKFSHITPQLKAQGTIYNRPQCIQNFQPSQPAYLRELLRPYTCSRNTRRSTLKLKFFHTTTFDCRVHKSNTFLILSVTIPQFFGTPSQLRNSPSVA